MLMTTYAVKR